MRPSNIDRLVMRFAGVVVFVSVLLGYYMHPGWFFLTGFVGLNLLQASFTGFCPMAMILKKLGVAEGSAF